MWSFKELFLVWFSSGLNNPTSLPWIWFIIVADVIGNDKSYWLLNPVPRTGVTTCIAIMCIIPLSVRQAVIINIISVLWMKNLMLGKFK